jgi:hypothetical protein
LKGLNSTAAPTLGTLVVRAASNTTHEVFVMSKAAGLFHVSLTVLNSVLCVGSLVAGNYGQAAFSGVVAAILAWQLTW